MSAAARSRGSQAHRRAALASQRKKPTDRRKLVAIAGSIAVVAVVALVVLGGVLRSGSSTTKAVQHTAPASGFVLGSSSAPVTLDAWEDFQCPICKAANASVIKQIESEYVDTGKVKIQYHQFPFLGQESIWAAEASEEAAAQGKFWDFESAAFAAQKAENSGALSKDNLKKIAQSIGLDMTAFNKSLDSDSYLGAVQAEKQAGVQQGVGATPTFFVNGTQVGDWRDYDGFKALIDTALATAPAVPAAPSNTTPAS